MDGAEAKVEEAATGGEAADDRLSADEKWDRLFASPESQAWMARAAARLEADIEAGDICDFDPGDLPE